MTKNYAISTKSTLCSFYLQQFQQQRAKQPNAKQPNASLQQFNQQRGKQPNLYSQMPALQFGPGGVRQQRPGMARPFFPNKAGAQQQMGARLPQFGQVGRLAGNPSVTIQVSSFLTFFWPGA